VRSIFRRSLTIRTLLVGGVLAALLGAVFAVLVVAVREQQAAGRLALRSQQAIGAGSALETSLVNLENGVRGYVASGRERLLEPFRTARRMYPAQAERLSRLVADEPRQQAAVRQIATGINDYVALWALPLVGLADERREVAQSVLATGGNEALTKLLSVLQPISLVALLATLVLLFGFQGEQILAQPLIIAMLAVPILIQVYFNAGLAYVLNRAAGEAHCVAGPSALIGASNFFELAVAAAISLFGFNSGAALATVVGVLIEVPVMLSVVKIVNSTRDWYEAGDTVRQRIASERAGG